MANLFWDRFFNLCVSKGTKPNPLAKEINISSGILSKWKNTDALPNGESLAKIADYLDCSVDYLLGRTDEPNSIFGELKSGSQVSDIELLYDSLDSEDKAEIRGIIKGMLLADKYKHIPRSTTNAV